MGIVWIILIGFVAGLIARYLVPGSNNPSGFILTVVLGIAGALLGGFLGRAVGWYREGDPVGFAMAVVGSIVLLVLHRLIARRPHGA